jgi:hypothetical protein
LTEAVFKSQVKTPHGHWTVGDSMNVRAFLDNYAQVNNFNPLVAENWYHHAKLKLMDFRVCTPPPLSPIFF